jgi:periplasmic divalent cation tolerance protein
MRLRSVAALQPALLLACWCGTAQAYRPFDGTDAAVAETGELEIEFGALECTEAVAQPGGDTLASERFSITFSSYERISLPLHHCPSFEVADRIGRALVEERLVACVNIIPGMHSIYRWQGKIETATEVVLIAKSRAALFEEIEERITELHPYDCPCLVAWPIEAGHQPYLDWLEQETTS